MPIMDRGNILAYTNASSTYKETRIKTASQGQLIIMLYDEAIKQLGKAQELLTLDNSGKNQPGRIEEINKAIMKAEEIVTELMVSLDFEQGGEVSQNLFALYTWFNRELMEANITKDSNKISSVKNMLTELRGSWNEIVKKYNAENANRETSSGVNIAG